MSDARVFYNARRAQKGWYWEEIDEDGALHGEPHGPFESAAEAGRLAREWILQGAEDEGPCSECRAAGAVLACIFDHESEGDSRI